MTSLRFKLKMFFYFGGRKNFTNAVLSMQEDTISQRRIIRRIRNDLAEIRHLTADNNLILLELEEILDNEITALNSIAGR